MANTAWHRRHGTPRGSAERGASRGGAEGLLLLWAWTSFPLCSPV